MAFWRRINQSNLQLISNQYRRFYFQAPYTSSIHQTTISVFEKPVCSSESKPYYFYRNVRSFAAPVQASKNKKVETGKDRPRLNKQITASVVRLVMEDGEHSIVSIQEALQLARKKALDLVEVQKKENPPVCRLMDYNQEMYRRCQKEKEIAKSKSGDTVKKGMCKIRFTGKIEEKDLKMKAENVIRLMERGYRVKCMAMGQGKEGIVEDLGGILSRLTDLIEDVCFVESGPNVEKTNAFVIVKHAKFGPTKKGGAKKSKVAGGNIAEPSTESATNNQRPPHDECGESGSESEDTLVSDEDDLPMPSPMQMQDENLDDKFLHPKPDNNSRYPRPETSLECDNRYKRSDPRSPFAPPSLVMSEPQFLYPRQEFPNMGQSTRESVRSESQFRHPPRQPPQNMGKNTRESIRSESQLRYPPLQPLQNMCQNIRQSVRLEMPYQHRQPPQNMRAAPSVQATKHAENEASKPLPSFGIFSSPNSNSSGERGTAADAPVSNEGNRYSSIRNRGMGGKANQNPGSQFDGSRKPDNDTGGQEKFGIFSTPNKMSKSN